MPRRLKALRFESYLSAVTYRCLFCEVSSHRACHIVRLDFANYEKNCFPKQIFCSENRTFWESKKMSGCPASYFFLLFGISPTFSYFSTEFLLFPTFWLLKAKFFPIFCDFPEILQLFCDFVSKICNFLVNFEDFGKCFFNFEKISLFF